MNQPKPSFKRGPCRERGHHFKQVKRTATEKFREVQRLQCRRCGHFVTETV